MERLLKGSPLLLKNRLWVGAMGQVVESLPHEALSLNSSTTKRKQNKNKKIKVFIYFISVCPEEPSRVLYAQCFFELNSTREGKYIGRDLLGV
jgi:hypothetical protein